MRSRISIVCCVFAFALFLVSLGVVVSASALEGDSVPDQTVAVFVDPNTASAEGQVSSVSDTANGGVSLLAAVDDNGFAGLAGWSLSTQLGDITLYCPADVDSSGIVIVDNELFNMNNAAVYFYCPEYPSYTFSASRFSSVVYRNPDAGYSNIELQSTSCELVRSDFRDYAVVLLCALCFILVLLSLFLSWRGR